MSLYATTFFNDSSLVQCPTRGVGRRGRGKSQAMHTEYVEVVRMPGKLEVESVSYPKTSVTPEGFVSKNDFIAECKNLSAKKLVIVKEAIRNGKIKVPYSVSNAILSL